MDFHATFHIFQITRAFTPRGESNDFETGTPGETGEIITFTPLEGFKMIFAPWASTRDPRGARTFTPLEGCQMIGT